MTSLTGLSPNNPSRYLGANVAINTVVTRNRAPTGADYRMPENGKLYPFNTFWLVGKDPTTGIQGDLWYLSKIVSNVAFWVQLASGSNTGIFGVNVDASTPPGTDPVLPDPTNLITVTGAQVATGIIGANVIRTNSLAAYTFTIEIQQTAAVAALDTTKNGVAHFNSAQFSVVNGFVSALNSPSSQSFSNLGITLSGTTFTVTSANGTALSATNPAYVILQSSTPGLQKLFTITANQSFTQAQLGNNLFGLTSGVDMVDLIGGAVNAPFYLYAVSNSAQTAIAFMISRVPHRTNAPLAAKIAQAGNTNATTQGSFYSLAAITAADYDSMPCLLVGSFRMRYASSLWTVQTLTNFDGISQYQEGTSFGMPAGHFGAASGKYFANNGGTAPNQNNAPFGAAGYGYIVEKDGTIDFRIAYPAVNVAGVGAVTLQLAFPYAPINGGGAGSWYFHDGSDYYPGAFTCAPTVSLSAILVYANNIANGVAQNADIVLNTELSFLGSFQADIL